MMIDPLVVLQGYKFGMIFSIRKIPRKAIEFPHFITRGFTGRKLGITPIFGK
jgi:hypothetical protein